MVLNAKKRRMLAEAVSKLKVGVSPSSANVATLVHAPPAPTPAPSPSTLALADLRQKGVVEVAASQDEDTCSSLVFKKKRGTDVAVPVLSASDGCAPSFREKPLSASSPRHLVIHEGGGGVLLEAILARLLLLN